MTYFETDDYTKYEIMLGLFALVGIYFSILLFILWRLIKSAPSLPSSSSYANRYAHKGVRLSSVAYRVAKRNRNQRLKEHAARSIWPANHYADKCFNNKCKGECWEEDFMPSPDQCRENEELIKWIDEKMAEGKAYRKKRDEKTKALSDAWDGKKGI